MSIINKGVFDAGKVFILQTGNDWPTSQTTTADVAEASSNLYFTNTRVLAALSGGTLTVGNVNSSGDIIATGNLIANGLIIRNITVTNDVLLGNVTVTTINNASLISANIITAQIWNGLYTANVIESGSALYYTNSRARSAFTAGKGIQISENGTVVNIGSSAVYNLDINGSVGGNVQSTMSTFVTFPSTPTTTRFILRSLHVANMSDTTSLISGNILYTTGNTASFANQIPVAAGGVLEFIKKGQLFQPGDKINLQGFNSAGAATANLMTAMATYEAFNNDISFIGIGQPIANVNTNTLIYDSPQSYSIIESIKFVNLQNTVAPIRAYWGDANGVPKAYLAYNLQIPPNSSVELLQAPKRIELGDEIWASYTNAPNAAVSAFVSARLGPAYSISAYTPDITTGNTLSVSFASSASEGTTVYYTIE